MSTSDVEVLIHSVCKQIPTIRSGLVGKSMEFFFI